MSGSCEVSEDGVAGLATPDRQPRGESQAPGLQTQQLNSLNSIFLFYVTKYYLHDIKQYSEISMADVSMFFTNETFNRLVTSILQFYNYVNI